jgi:hypothetical protein
MPCKPLSFLWVHGVVPAITIFLILQCLASAPQARDFGQWGNVDSEISKWFRALMQPDTWPPVSCCGEADAYWADKFEIGPNGQTIAIITDDRDDGPLMRVHEEIGKKYTSFRQTK